jgi:hypothetical protein
MKRKLSGYFWLAVILLCIAMAVHAEISLLGKPHRNGENKSITIKNPKKMNSIKLKIQEKF